VSDIANGPAEDEQDLAKSAPEDRASMGPFDDSEANAVRPYVDLGGVKILPRTDLHLRLEVEEGSKRVVAVGLDFAGSTLQVQPFAAPRSTGLWNEIRAQIVEQIHKQGSRHALRVRTGRQRWRLFHPACESVRRSAHGSRSTVPSSAGPRKAAPAGSTRRSRGLRRQLACCPLPPRDAGEDLCGEES
jgi:hypothetical protein